MMQLHHSSRHLCTSLASKDRHSPPRQQWQVIRLGKKIFCMENIAVVELELDPD